MNRLAKKAFEEGVAYFKEGEYELAIAAFTEAIRLEPQNAVSYVFRGLAYQRKCDFDKTIADYTEAIRLDLKIRCGLLLPWHSP